MPLTHTIIIGGGAAGFFTALSIKQHNPQASVLILEATTKLLAKVKISGGGRCNVTHACFEPKALLPQYPRAHKTLHNNFKQFGPTQTIAWFKQHGVNLVTEADGRMFPDTHDSQTIVDCLLNEARRQGISIKKECKVTSITQTPQGHFTLQTESQTIECQHLVLATGGSPMGYQLLAQLGHTPVPPVPSLFTFNIDHPNLSELAGISVPQAKGTLLANGESITQQGPLLVTHWGLSGPCILRLSAWGAIALAASKYQGVVQIDWFPTVHHDALRQQLLTLKQQHANRLIKNWPISTIGEMPQRLWEFLLHEAQLSPDTEASTIKDKQLNQLSEFLKRTPFIVNGKGPFKEEFVTAGGMPLNEINLKTYQSKLVPHLYIVGELLNIDGITGGFNFQNAWTSGFLAGKSIAEPA